MSNPYRISVCVDFGDDLIHGWFDRERLDALFRAYRDWGATRVYWIHVPGRFMRSVPWDRIEANAQETLARVGEFLPAAVRAARDHGLEIFAVFKPFDVMTNHTMPFGIAGTQRWDRGIDSISGPVFCGWPDVAVHRHRRLERDMSDVSPDVRERRVRRIVLTAHNAGADGPRPEDIRITVSGNNGVYRPYAGPFMARGEGRDGGGAIILDGLDIAEPFLALHCTTARGAFANTLEELVRLEDTNGEEIPFTYGLLSRADRYPPATSSGGSGATGAPWPQAPRDGYSFNIWNPDVLDDSRLETSDVRRWRVVLDNARGYLALAKGKERYVTGALSPMYDEVHDYWLGYVAECMAAGVDGVDLRMANHNRCLEWDRYGFGPPVLAEYVRRHGPVNGSAAMDPELRRQVIADGYTGFLSKAAELVRAGGGGRMQLHVGVGMGGTLMGLKWDWRRWLVDGLADEVTLKNADPADEKPFVVEVRREAGRLGKPVHACPWLCDWSGAADATRAIERRLRAARAAGEAGFILYESAAFVHLDERGNLRQPFPEMGAVLRRAAEG